MNDPKEKKRMDDFDWVNALSQCSLSTVFEKLKMEVDADVKSRNALRKIDASFGAQYGFAMVDGMGSFKVILNSNRTREVVTFDLKEKSISVSDSNGLLFEATLTLNNDGECRVKIKGEERELWHVRRMALEHLFFGIY
jgi:hypothetical protein